MVVVTPELCSHLFSLDTELLTIDIGKLGEGEGPAEECGSHGAGTDLWINLELLAHGVVLISGNDNVDVLNDSDEVLVHGFSINLELENGSVDLVDHEHWLDLLTESLSQDSLSLHSDTFDVIDDDESTIGDSQCGGNL